tara:strand:+ start:232 stop:1218 length:987 start_codon:yes stop_codon:yes gene_type:complete
MKKIIFINILFIFFLVLSIEVIIRLLGLAKLQGYDKSQYYFENGITLRKPNIKLKVFGEYQKTDTNGFRIPLNNYNFDEQKESILILGDSVSTGVGIKEKDTFIGLMRVEKNKNLLNSSVSGHNVKSYLYLIKKYKNSENINFTNTIIFLCLNDIVPFQGIIRGNSDNNEVRKVLFDRPIIDKVAIKINVYFRERSALFVLLKGFITNPAKRHYSLMANLYEEENNLIKLKRHILDIYKYSQIHGIETKFILLPYAYQVKNNCRADLMKPQTEINRLFKENNVQLNDYSKEFCNEPKRDNLFLPYDPVHLSSDGHKFVSKLLINDKIF